MAIISRRAFLKWAGVTGLALAGASCTKQPPSPLPIETAAPETSTSHPAAPKSDQAYLSVARCEDPAALVGAAVAALGGIERFVKPGKDVIIKPNICTDYHPPEYAATTNPQVVAALVSLCLGAGAKRVRVMDNPFGGSPTSAYAVSGIEAAVRAAGGEMEVMSPVKYASFDIPEGRDIQSWEFYRDILETDVLINVPIAKHHGLARLTLGGKNSARDNPKRQPHPRKPGAAHRRPGQPRPPDADCDRRLPHPDGPRTHWRQPGRCKAGTDGDRQP